MSKIQKHFGLRISKEWISAFTANIMGVIIGIALTFGVSELVQQCSDRKQVREMLVLVEDEILTNRVWLEARVRFYQQDREACRNILAAAKQDTAPSDTVMEHIRWVCSYEDSYAGTQSWDAFRNSGMMQKLHKPEMVSYLTHFYFMLGKYGAIWDEYCKQRDVVRNTLFAELQADTTAQVCLQILSQSKECVSFMKLASVLTYGEAIEQNFGYVNFVFNAVRNLTNSEKLSTAYFTLAAQAHLYYQQKDYRSSGQTYDEAFRSNGGKGLRDDYYNAACSWALANEPDIAFVMLDKCAAAGYSNYSWIQQDTDLQSLHSDPRWHPLIEKVRQNE